MHGSHPSADRARTLGHPSARAAQVLADGAALVLASVLVGRSPGVAVAVIALSVPVIAMGDLYRSRVNMSRFLFFTPLAVRVLVVSLAVDTLTDPGLELGVALGRSLLTAAAVTVARLITVGLIRAARARGLVSHATLVVGTPAEASRIHDLMAEHRASGLVGVGTWDPTRSPVMPDLAQAIARSGARVAIVSAHDLPSDLVLCLTRSLQRIDVQTFVTVAHADLFGVEPDDRIEHLWDVPLLRLPRTTSAPVARVAKRLIDIVGSATALVATAPLMGLAALAVWVTMGRPLLFRQIRIGLGGQPIEVVKFRTVSWRGPTTTAWDVSNADAAHINAVGRFLRATSIDELPQLVSVLRGTMSLVGPRPERPEYARRYAEQFPHYDDRHRVPAGLTGLAQVQGLRGDTSIEDRARFDNRYIDSWTIGLDIRILFRTLLAVIRGTGR